MADNPYTDRSKKPGPNYQWSGIQGTWVHSGGGKSKAKKPKPVGYLSEKHTPGFEAKLKGKSWYTQRHMKQNDAAKQDKKREAYGRNRQIGIMAEKENAAKRGRTPNRGASTGGAGSSRPRSIGSALKPHSSSSSGEPSQWAKAAFAKIVKEHPQGINFKALRNWDNEDKAYKANPNLRRGNNANPEKSRSDALKLKPGIDFAALRRADKNWGKPKSGSKGPQ